jgi:hypothetical protein
LTSPWYPAQTIEEIDAHRQKEVLALFPYLDGALRRDLPPVAAAVLADIVLDQAAEEKKTKVVQVQTQILSDFETLCAEMKTPEKTTWCTTTQLFDGAHGASSMCRAAADAGCPRAG